jgi:cysteine desulfurase
VLFRSIDYTINLVKQQVNKLRDMSPLWDMVKEGIDLNTVQWAAH